MNIQLPPEPTGDIPLPEQLQNPPSLKDITNAVEYNNEVWIGYGITFLFHISFFCLPLLQR